MGTHSTSPRGSGNLPRTGDYGWWHADTPARSPVLIASEGSQRDIAKGEVRLSRRSWMAGRAGSRRAVAVRRLRGHDAAVGEGHGEGRRGRARGHGRCSGDRWACREPVARTRPGSAGRSTGCRRSGGRDRRSGRRRRAWTGAGGTIDAGPGEAGGLDSGGPIVDVARGRHGWRRRRHRRRGRRPTGRRGRRIRHRRHDQNRRRDRQPAAEPARVAPERAAPPARAAPGTGGATGTGGVTGTGGATATGGLAGTGGATAPDAGPDVQPDTSTLANGLLAYYPCESASGSILPDMSGHGNDATLSASGSFSFGSGPKTGLGNALTLIQANKRLRFDAPSDVPWAHPDNHRNLGQDRDGHGLAATLRHRRQRQPPRNPLTGTNTISYMNFVPQTAATVAIFAITNTGYPGEQQISEPASCRPAPGGMWRSYCRGARGTLYIDGVDRQS